jgi:hypothetical protein
MSEFESMNDEQREFEQSLKQLQPAEPELDVADLMFRAGQDAARRKVRRQVRRWQLSTLVTSACALVAVSFLWSGTLASPTNGNSIATDVDTGQAEPIPEDNTGQPEIEKQQSVPQIVVETEEPAISPPPLVEQRPLLFDWWNRQTTVSVSTDESYIDLRNRVLRDGVDALPERDLSGGSCSTEPLTSSPLRLRDALEQDLWNQI